MIALRSYDNLTPRRKTLWRSVRFAAPRRMRWFYEGDRRVRGQLWYQERKALYGAVRKYRPESVFEVGTWHGGGSTYFIANALRENGRGLLHTIEIDPAVHAIAVENFQSYLPELKPFVEFHLGDSKEVYPPILSNIGSIDMVFLDGAQDAQQTLQEFRLFEPFLIKGSVIACHDWDNEKMASVRPMLEGSDGWNVVQTIGAPVSVGFAICLHQ